MQTIRPAHDQLFCKPDEAIEKTASGLLLAKDAAEKPKTAVVINVGKDITDYKPDDRIVYKSYSTSDIKLENEDYFLVAEEDVLGVIVEV